MDQKLIENQKLACFSVLTQLLMLEERTQDQQTAVKVLSREYDRLRGLLDNQK